MYYSDYTIRLLQQDRLREAARLRAQNDLIRDASEAVVDEHQAGLISQIKNLIRTSDESSQPQEANDVRRAPAL